MRNGTFSLWLCSALWTCSWAASGGQASDARMTPQVKAVERARASVVNIHSERTSRDRDLVFDGGAPRKVNGMGTGVIIDERGFIVTNQHVVAGVDSLRVTLHDGSTYAAREISANRTHDLAIIKIDPSRPLTVVPLGTSSDLRLGETVLAVGNPFGYEHSVTMGIISSLSRDVEVNETQSYRNLLQTDASINPGNSGGPLLNLDGEIVGINVAIRANAQRIGFAIPIDDARRYIARLLDVRHLNYTYHGLISHDVKTPDQRMLVIDAAEANSPAASAGFQPGDVVTQVGAVRVNDQADLERAFLGHSAGTPIEVTVQRRQEPQTLMLQLASAVQPAGGRKPVQSGIRPAAVTNDPVNSKSWSILGLTFDKAEPTFLQAIKIKHRYNGGLKVVDVRSESPAAQSGVQRGDILVGLHPYETTKLEDIQWILNQKNVASGHEPVQFYLVRQGEVLRGHLRLSQRAK